MGVDGLSWKKGFVDCLVTDPPYGIRAMAHSDAQTGGLNSVEGLDRLGLTLKNVYAALFRIAGYLLRTKGLLVFLIPSTDEFKVDARSIEIMCGDTFRLDKPIAYQELTGGYGRYCVTVRKI
ncbi:hypothetical protein GNI_082290 [Gregarina niphandrodes]|uniref:Uncharacterized protein n=1 Tax=Gregarina niphandrodes TaxID=110365 RepID=A0A023B675_GRENI|nr:hypothetical protein GNI_082290 [Gregarina niphandrodes]EZG65678.1 hypothetical protein GNI_082290 [Gregarina niphandrodes]|eukprot:XP_011134059.1 hypothetical protein GNI_082290 [Gregarina niphandrodes]